MESIITLAVAAALGFIPANIAKKKGHSFGLWWFYGWMLFIVAIIHVQFIEDYNAPKREMTSSAPHNTKNSLTKVLSRKRSLTAKRNNFSNKHEQGANRGSLFPYASKREMYL